jgi:hypothetical protein
VGPICDKAPPGIVLARFELFLPVAEEKKLKNNIRLA